LIIYLFIYDERHILRKYEYKKTNANKRFRTFFRAESKFMTIFIFHQNFIAKIIGKLASALIIKITKIKSKLSVIQTIL